MTEHSGASNVSFTGIHQRLRSVSEPVGGKCVSTERVKPNSINTFIKECCVYSYFIEARNFLIQFWHSHPFALCAILFVIASASGISIYIQMKPGEWGISFSCFA